MKFDPKQSWYHGSPLELSILNTGSTITQKRELARIFSHKPSIVSISDDGQIRHNGTISGYLYLITDEIQSQDVIPHPQTTMSDGDEWLTTCELHLQLLCTTDVISAEQLTDDDYAMLRDKLSEQE
jgi:hypothetical protein